MTAGLVPQEPLVPVPGIRLASIAAGIKKSGKPDLLLMEMAAESKVAAVFTTNQFAAAPVLLCKAFLQQAAARYLLVNSGNANCGLGDAGLQAARRCCSAVANATGVDVEQVLPFSTGVIAEPLVEALDDSETLTYLHACASSRRHPVEVPKCLAYLDCFLADQALLCGLTPKLGDQHLRVLTILGLPGASEPGFLDRLNSLGFAYRWMTLSGGSATLGMRLMAVEMRDGYGQRFDTATAFLHTLGYSVSLAFPILQIISIVMMLMGPRAQGLTDNVLGTVAINRRAGM